jgi:hypothetical protein
MSVMMRTVNPEATAELEAGRDRRLPHVAQMLLYHARPGEGRRGRLEAPAVCNAVLDEDHVDLTVIWEGDELVTWRNVPRRTDQNTFNAWTFNAVDQKHYVSP